MINEEYIIVGDTDQFEGCLVFTCGGSEEKAKEIFNRLLNSPTEDDKKIIKGHKNLRIEKIQKRNCWWNDLHD